MRTGRTGALVILHAHNTRHGGLTTTLKTAGKERLNAALQKEMPSAARGCIAVPTTRNAKRHTRWAWRLRGESHAAIAATN